MPGLHCFSQLAASAADLVPRSRLVQMGMRFDRCFEQETTVEVEMIAIRCVGVRIERVFTVGWSVWIQVGTQDQALACRTCGCVAHGVRGRDERRLSDLMAVGQGAVIQLRVRWLFCRNGHCA